MSRQDQKTTLPPVSLTDLADEESARRYLCPITLGFMTDPVMVMESGQTYQRDAILHWFKTNNTDPMTNKVLPNNRIVSNIALKGIIHQYLEEKGIKIESQKKEHPKKIASNKDKQGGLTEPLLFSEDKHEWSEPLFSSTSSESLLSPYNQSTRNLQSLQPPAQQRMVDVEVRSPNRV